MENRLQFRHHTQIFETRQEAIDYIYTQIRYTDTGMAANDRSYGFSLFAEPTILRYKNEEDESNPHVIVAIGANTNDGSVGYGDNRFCIIDIDNTEGEIKKVEDDLAAAITALKVKVLDSNTLKLTANETEEGTEISGDVKLSSGEIFDDFRRANSIIATENGLFMHVSMTYDEANDSIKFIVNGDVLDVKLSNSKLVSGSYDKRDESLHLVNNDGSEVVIDCEELIAEWGVEGENSKTPVVLTREESGYGSDDGHSHVEPWQDVLMADVRIKDEQKVLQDDGTYKYEKDPDSLNILNRTSDGRYLFVDGRASNIIYYDNGVRSNVRDALDKVSKNKPSSDDRNIIQSKVDGLFASASLEYLTNENTLVFKTSGQPDARIKLNSVELFKDIHYDPTTEELVIMYVDNTGQVQVERIPLGEMLVDWEWEAQNEGHNVWLTKTRVTAGNDKVSADAQLYDASDNILVDRDHKLYVKGTADNINYVDDMNVKDAIDGLMISAATSIAAEHRIEGAIAAETERATAAEAALASSIGQALTDITNEDHSINVDKTDPLKPVVSVNLSDEVEDGRKSIVKLNNDGLYVNVDLSYNREGNKLIFHTSGEEADKEITLNGWEPTENTDGAIELRKVSNPETNKDVLYADVIINTTHGDNAIVNDHGSLYVGANTVVENSTTFQCLSAETKAVEALLGVEGNCADEIVYPGDRYSILSGATSFPEADLILENAINEIQEEIVGITVEINGVETDTASVTALLDDENKTTISADVKLQGGGDDVTVDDANAIGVIGGDNGGLYLSKSWNCGEYEDGETSTDDDEDFMNYNRV